MDKKVVIIISLFTVVVLGGGMYFASNQPQKAAVGKTAGAKVQTIETSFDFKDVKYSGGNAKHGFKIKNSGTKDLTIANMVTSCMCTKVYLQAGNIKSPEFGMKGMSSDSSWKGVVKPGEEAQVVADFDPTAHGPQGVGPISRIVSFETNDPDHPYVEFTFNAVVVK
ncbi:MAG: DUF1573 domain-containing protein [Candidatus Levybacteria bacterium]|nr:DUF1573 domain-containing protein [Candidatus Levybacteria bacterium]